MRKAENERFKRECEAVKDLGDQIGYGNMMEIASALWAKDLKDKYGFEMDEAAYYPTLRYNMKPGELTNYFVQRRKELIEKFNKWGW